MTQTDISKIAGGKVRGWLRDLLGNYIHGWSAISPERPSSVASLSTFLYSELGSDEDKTVF